MPLTRGPLTCGLIGLVRTPPGQLRFPCPGEARQRTSHRPAVPPCSHLGTDDTETTRSGRQVRAASMQVRGEARSGRWRWWEGAGAQAGGHAGALQGAPQAQALHGDHAWRSAEPAWHGGCQGGRAGVQKGPWMFLRSGRTGRFCLVLRAFTAVSAAHPVPSSACPLLTVPLRRGPGQWQHQGAARAPVMSSETRPAAPHEQRHGRGMAGHGLHRGTRGLRQDSRGVRAPGSDIPERSRPVLSALCRLVRAGSAATSAPARV